MSRAARAGPTAGTAAAGGIAVVAALALVLAGWAWLPGELRTGARVTVPVGSGPPPPPPPPAPPPPAPPPAGSPVQHVFLIFMENEGRAGVLANGSFERYLLTRYATAPNYYAVTHPSAPNYLTATAGSYFGQNGSDAWHLWNGTNLADSIERVYGASPTTWSAFAQSMPRPCDTSNAYPYAVRHYPWVYYADIVDNPARCDAHDLSFTAWTADLAHGTIPRFGWFSPNLLDDGHDTGPAYGDAWLRTFLSPLLNASWFRSSVWFVCYDEAVGSTAGFAGARGGNVYFAAVSPYSPASRTIATDVSHYNLLTTVEWLLRVPSTGHNDSAANPPMTALFTFGTTNGSAPARPSAGGADRSTEARAGGGGPSALPRPRAYPR
jgi:hypothetical protein